jgi:hypothetical protein
MHSFARVYGRRIRPLPRIANLVASRALALFISGFCLTSQAWAIGAVTITGSLPRDSSRGYFDLTVTVKDVLPSDVALKPKETNLNQRMSVFMTDLSSSEPVGTNPAGTTAVEFYIEYRDDVLSEINSQGNYDLTFYPRIRQVNNSGLSNLIDNSADKKSLRVKVKYLEDLVAKGDPVDNTILVNPTVANEAPANVSVLSSHKQLSVAFEKKSSIAFIGISDTASTDAPTEATIIALRLGETYPSLPAKIFSPDAASDADTTCEFDQSAVDGGNCISCSSDKAYLDVASLVTLDPDNIKVKSATKGARDIAGLDNGVPYAVVAMYQPDGIQRSLCLTATPSENFTLTELNGEGPAKEENFRCFIATAAYGSPLHKNLRGLRWFRDGLADLHPAGNALVEAYYRFSPPVAEWVARHPLAAVTARGMLWAPAMLTGMAMAASREAGLTPSEGLLATSSTVVALMALAAALGFATARRRKKC